jgi:glucose/arabinose dehydrogenase
MRINTDGSVPADNPFIGQDTAQPEIFSFGHRNPQGMARNPDTGDIWVNEHGPQGGDEINILQAGANFGWPVATFGKEYGSGFAIGEGSDLPGTESPIYYWVPSIAPSGMAFYNGDLFPVWKGSLFVGALAAQLLVRLSLDGEKVTGEERLLQGLSERIRDVRAGPDGAIYLVTDDSAGRVLKVVPTK